MLQFSLTSCIKNIFWRQLVDMQQYSEGYERYENLKSSLWQGAFAIYIKMQDFRFSLPSCRKKQFLPAACWYAAVLRGIWKLWKFKKFIVEMWIYIIHKNWICSGLVWLHEETKWFLLVACWYAAVLRGHGPWRVD